MDTKRHHAIAKVGEKTLRAALARANRKDLRIGAFYLGNWLTDVSQVIDPPQYRNVLRHIDELDASITAMFDRMNEHAPAFFLGPLDAAGKVLLGRIRRRLDDARRDLVARTRKVFESEGDLVAGFRAAFRFVGYFKFVLSGDGKADSPKKMDPDCYFRVFDDRFRQYFPHEHLDRPEVSDGVFATEKASGPLNAGTPARGDAPGDLYAYLREDVRLAAGLLQYLDGGPPDQPLGRFGWAQATFHPSRKKFTATGGKEHPVDDTDFEWNRHLSLFGHALHAAEDYFAHSNFIEHASSAIPKKYKTFQRYEDYLSPFNCEDVLARRLKEWRPGFQDGRDDWKGLKDDTHVATGYFDWRDTVISLSHVVEELGDRPRSTVGSDVDALLEYEYAKLLTDTLELCAKPLDVWNADRNDPSHEAYDEDEANGAVRWLREKGGHPLKLAEGQEPTLNLVLQYMLEHGALKDQHPEAKRSFADAVRLLGRGVGAAFLGYNLYTLVRELGVFLENPLAWLGAYLPKKAYELLKKYGEVYAKTLVANAFGANRIGCHSLINKDSGPELFHDWAMECAKAVHWYAVNTMTRHAAPAEAAVARSHAPGGPSNLVTGYRWIDWLELLEYFLAHPFANGEFQVGERIVAGEKQHVARPGPQSTMSSDSLASLAREYTPTFVRTVGGPTRFSWEVIADANFPTQGMTTEQRKAQVNKVLATNQGGVLVSDGVNYAFKPGYPVAIPFQKTIVPDFAKAKVTDRWWYKASLEKHGIITSWLADGRPSAKAPANAHRWVAVNKSGHGALVKKATEVRSQLEQAYNA